MYINFFILWGCWTKFLFHILLAELNFYVKITKVFHNFKNAQEGKGQVYIRSSLYKILVFLLIEKFVGIKIIITDENVTYL